MSDPRMTLAGVQERFVESLKDANHVVMFDNMDAALADIPVIVAALTAALDTLDDLDSKHQFQGHECLCGFSSPRSRSRTEHLTVEVRTAITAALEPGTHNQ